MDLPSCTAVTVRRNSRLNLGVLLIRYRELTLGKSIGSIQISGKLPTYPSPKPSLSLTSHLGQNVGLGEGVGGQLCYCNRPFSVVCSVPRLLNRGER